ncbi:metallo phosphoesterase related [Anaeramoeba ignava]|uniref:Metallo phosphoesterase related n=1 Tax=Anaeramoeba ignava TaxID=1746090 RepID=A0A9Q0LYP8_ANAIG|nr:metallo phosphoesterase related [Anaeramoeba ignava]
MKIKFTLFFSSLTSIFFIIFWFKSFTSFYSFQLHSNSSIRIAILADPQMEGDSRILSQGIYGEMNNKMNDLYYKWIANGIHNFIFPNKVVILGDIFSFQRTSNQEFNRRIERFNNIFELIQKNKSIELITMAGNHDIGYGIECVPFIIERFEKNFNKLNIEMNESNHIFAFLNNIPLDGSLNEIEKSKTWDFVLKLSEVTNEKPIILFMHIPLYKPKGSCPGDSTLDQFESIISKNAVVEQNLLSEENSKFILEKIKPKLIFTGHDHYGCIYKHEKNNENNYIFEYTLRSILGDFGGGFVTLEIEENSFSLNQKYNYYVSHFPFPTIMNITIILIWFLISFLVLIFGFCLSIYQFIFIKKEQKEKKE